MNENMKPDFHLRIDTVLKAELKEKISEGHISKYIRNLIRHDLAGNVQMTMTDNVKAEFDTEHNKRFDDFCILPYFKSNVEIASVGVDDEDFQQWITDNEEELTKNWLASEAQKLAQDFGFKNYSDLLQAHANNENERIDKENEKLFGLEV